MKRLTTIFGIIAFMFGCAVLPKNYIPVGYESTNNHDNLSCQDLYEHIAKKWGYHADFMTCYFYNEKLIDEITQNQVCFIGLEEEEVIRLFGNPTMITEDRVAYNISKSCSEIDTLFASYALNFKLLDKEVVKVKFQEADVHY